MKSLSNVPRAPRVLQVLGSLGTGGAEMMVLSAAESLADECAMDFLVFGYLEGTLETRALATGGRIFRLSAPRESGRRKFVSDLKQLLIKENYEAVHSHINLASGLVMKAARAAAVPIRIAHSHGTVHPASTARRRVYRWLSQKLISKHSTVLAACGEEAGRSLFRASWTDGRGIVIPNGVDLDKFLDARKSREVARGRLGISTEQRAIGMIARLVDFKNHDFMLDVVALDKAQSGNCVLLIIGDGPLRSKLEDRVEDLGMSDRVKFLGLRDDVPQILGALDLVVISSFYEGLPVALVEAQAAGIPALVSDKVTAESDLGLGIITWLSLGDPAKWLLHLYDEVSGPSPSLVRERFAETGYDIRSSAGRLLALYGDQRVRN